MLIKYCLVLAIRCHGQFAGFRLTPEDVAASVLHLIDQSPSSNIEMVALDPPL